MIETAHNSAPEWQTCRFYASLRNVTHSKWLTIFKQPASSLWSNIVPEWIYEVRTVQISSLKHSIHWSYRSGICWWINERYNFPTMLLVSKGNCGGLYLCKKVTCELDQWVHTCIHTSTFIWEDGNPLCPLWLVICVDQLHRSVKGSQSWKHSWKLLHCMERSISISNHVTFHHHTL